MPDTDLTIHAGKFKGTTVEDAPSSYLRWAAENWRENDQRDRDLMAAINTELTYRDRHNTHFEETSG